MIDPEEIFKAMLSSKGFKPKMKRKRELLKVKPDERARFQALDGRCKDINNRLSKLYLERDGAKLAIESWWNEMLSTYDLREISSIEFDDEDGALWEMVPDLKSGD